MSCAVAVGVVLWDISMIAVATGAVAVTVVSAAVAAKREHDLLRKLAAEEIPTVVLDEESLKQHKLHERLEAANVAQEFEGADVIMETQKGEIIGFKQQEDGSYKLAAKYGVEGVQEWGGTNEQIEERLKQQYAYVKVKKEVAKRGYAVVEEEILEDNSIRVLVRRWD